MPATIKIGAATGHAKNDIVLWLNDYVDPMIHSDSVINGYDYRGKTWYARWRHFGGGWFMDVTFLDNNIAALFKLRWGGKTVAVNTVPNS